IRKLQVRSEQLLLRLKQLRFALDQINFQGAPVLDLLYAFAMQIIDGADLRFDRVAAGLRPPKSGIKRSGLQGPIVLHTPLLFAARIQVGAGNVISSPDLEQLSKRLSQPCAARKKILLALIDVELLLRNRRAPHAAERTCGNRNELGVGYMCKY